MLFPLGVDAGVLGCCSPEVDAGGVVRVGVVGADPTCCCLSSSSSCEARGTRFLFSLNFLSSSDRCPCKGKDVRRALLKSPSRASGLASGSGSGEIADREGEAAAETETEVTEVLRLASSTVNFFCRSESRACMDSRRRWSSSADASTSAPTLDADMADTRYQV